MGVTEGLAAAHAHFKLQEGRCRHVKVPGLCITRFSYKKGRSWMVAYNDPLFAYLAFVLVMNMVRSKQESCLIWSDFSSHNNCFYLVNRGLDPQKTANLKSVTILESLLSAILQIMRHGNAFRERFYCSAWRTVLRQAAAGRTTSP